MLYQWAISRSNVSAIISIFVKFRSEIRSDKQVKQRHQPELTTCSLHKLQIPFYTICMYPREIAYNELSPLLHWQNCVLFSLSSMPPLLQN